MSLYHAWDSSQKVAVNGAGTGVKALGKLMLLRPSPPHLHGCGECYYPFLMMRIASKIDPIVAMFNGK